MTVCSDWQKVRHLARYQRLMARRGIQSRALWWLARGVTVAAFGALAAFCVLVMATLPPGEGGRSNLLMLIFLGGGAFLLYLELMVLFNRLCVIPFDELLVSPLSGRAVLMERMYEQVRALPLYALLVIPVVITYGVTENAPLVFYPIALLAVFLTTTAIYASAALLLLLLLTFLKRRMSRETLALISSIVAALVFVIPRILDASTAGHGFQINLQGAVWSMLPMIWGARMIAAVAHAAPLQAVLYGLLLCAETVIIAGFALIWANRHLHDRIGRLYDGQHRARQKRVRSSQRARRSVWRVLPLSPATRAVLYKDWVRLRRTPSELIGLLFSALYLWFIVLRPGAGGFSGAWQLVIMICVVTLPTVRLGLSGLGLESAQVTLLMQAPASPGDVLIAKWLYAFLTAFGWSELSLLIYVLIIHPPVSAVVLTAICLLPLVAASSSITLPFAVYYAAFVATARQGRQRNIYTKPGISLQWLAQLPLYVLQAGILLYGVAPDWPGQMPALASLLTGSATMHVVLAIVASVAVAAVVCLIGWGMALKAWRRRLFLMRESGALD
ncbi:MAG: hypothetical protein OWT28_11250 [Firmicutes bacterium]|nr:hypothetical protein [Bacillota bacterium]